jgi:ankyrin repeat protein
VLAACEKNNIFPRLVNEFNIQVNDLNSFKETWGKFANKLLYNAAEIDDSRILEISVALGADLNSDVKIKRSGKNVEASILHLAVNNYSAEIIPFLLEKQPSLVQRKDESTGDTPLHWAVKDDVQQNAYSRVLMLDEKSSKQADVNNDTIVMQKNEDCLIAYWKDGAKTIEIAFEEKNVQDIVQLPKTGQESRDEELIAYITSKYRIPRRQKIIEYLLQRHDLSIHIKSPSCLNEYNGYLSDWRLNQANKPSNVLFLFSPDSKQWKAYFFKKGTDTVKEESEIGSRFKSLLRLEQQPASSAVPSSKFYRNILQAELEGSTLFGSSLKRLGDPWSKNNNGNSPLHLAILNLDIKEMLLFEKNVSDNNILRLLINTLQKELPYYFKNALKVQNKDGDTALHLLFKSKQLIEYLNMKKLSRKQQWTTTEIDQRNQLMLFSICESFVVNGTSHIVNNQLDTFLHLAAKLRLYKIIENTIRYTRLLNLPDIQNCYGQSVMSIIINDAKIYGNHGYQSILDVKVEVVRIEQNERAENILPLDIEQKRQNEIKLISDYQAIIEEQAELLTELNEKPADSTLVDILKIRKDAILSQLMELNTGSFINRYKSLDESPPFMPPLISSSKAKNLRQESHLGEQELLSTMNQESTAFNAGNSIPSSTMHANENQQPLRDEVNDNSYSNFQRHTFFGSKNNQRGNSKCGYIRHKVIGDGECGYTALGITRQQALELLTKDLNKIKTILQPAIHELLLIEEFYKYLIDNDYISSAISHERITQDLTGYGDDLSVLQGFLYYDVRDKRRDGGWSHPSTLQALAHICHLGLRIWRLGEQEQLVPHRSPQYDYAKYAEGTVDRWIDLLFTDGNHFDQLEIISETEELEERIYLPYSS